MTYKELWAELHPGEEFSMMFCPNDFDFGKDSSCIGNCSAHWSMEVDGIADMDVGERLDPDQSWCVYGAPELRGGFLHIHAVCLDCTETTLIPYSHTHGVYSCPHCGTKKGPGFY